MRSNLVRDYLLPTRVVLKSDNVFDVENILNKEDTQVYIGEQKYTSIKGKGFIVLDFGKELQGGIRILTHRFPINYGGKIRIRFGESVNECFVDIGEKNATNNHSLRDFEIYMPHLADQIFGQTGYRFIRIDFLEDIEYRLINIYASYEHRDIEFIGKFECDDELINKIYNVAKHTLFLNLQENLLEGVKRDRLVWIGDMQPEVLAYSYLYNDYSIVKTAIDDSIKYNPLPCWFGRIPTYSYWLIEILFILFKNTKDKNYVLSKFDYVNGVIDQLDLCVNDNGEIDYSKCKADAREGFFFDWPSNGTIDSKEGNRFIFIYVLNHYLELCSLLNVLPNSKTNNLIIKLNKYNQVNLTKKQVISLGYFANLISKEETKEKLFKDSAKGLSTFFSYFILKAMSEVGDINETIDILKEYYGGMLSRGATSFWEDFDIAWLDNSGSIDEITPNGLNDLHGDYGAWCYKGFRHSLCHGWSVGPISFLVENVAGISLNDNVLKVKPNLGKLKYIKVTIPSMYGPITIDIRNNEIKVTKPKEIELIK